MKLELFGDDKQGWGGSGEYEPGVDPVLMPCPFCGWDDELEPWNTHGPHFAVRCNNCQAEGPTVDGGEGGDDHIMTKAKCKKMCEKAFYGAIKEWNDRREGKRP